MLNWPPKDPDELLDYQVDWTDRLAADNIQTSSWVVPAGLTQSLPSFTSKTATIWFSGGTIGQTYKVLNRIVTSGGRTMDQTVGLLIRVR